MYCNYIIIYHTIITLELSNNNTQNELKVLRIYGIHEDYKPLGKKGISRHCISKYVCRGCYNNL